MSESAPSPTIDDRLENAQPAADKEAPLQQCWLDVIAAVREEQELFNFDSCIESPAHAPEAGVEGEPPAPGQPNSPACLMNTKLMQSESSAEPSTLIGPTIPLFARIVGHGLHPATHGRHVDLFQNMKALLTEMLVKRGRE
jgi:hypothetical protein